MTIFVGRRRKKKESPFTVTLLAARRMAGVTLSDLHKYLAELQRKGKRADSAIIRRYARNNGLNLQHRPKPWLFKAKSGEKVAMPAGYYAKVDGVLEDIVAR